MSEPPQKKKKLLALAIVCDEIFSDTPINRCVIANLGLGNANSVMKCCPVIVQDDEHVRAPLFYEKWLSEYLDYDFYKLFRMRRETFHRLYVLLSREGNVVNPKKRGRGIYLPITAEKALLMCLWYLGKNETLISISERFNVCEKSAHESVWKIITVLCDLKHLLIKWPRENDCVRIEREFRRKAGYPGVIGAIDGCHIEAKIPREQHDSYQNRKFRHSVSMQAICITNMMLTNASIGYPGSLHDARILRESNLGRYIGRYGPERFFYNRYQLVGDSAYPCETWLLTPYRNYGGLTAAQQRYNYAHSRTRIYIENTFGDLKGRWRKLQYVYVFSVAAVIKIITACCCLHNFCIMQNDIFDEIYEEQEEVIEAAYQDALEGINKREIICNIINNNY